MTTTITLDLAISRARLHAGADAADDAEARVRAHAAPMDLHTALCLGLEARRTALVDLATIDTFERAKIEADRALGPEWYEFRDEAVSKEAHRLLREAEALRSGPPARAYPDYARRAGLDLPKTW